MVRKQSYAFVRICVPSCQTTPVIEYKFNKSYLIDEMYARNDEIVIKLKVNNQINTTNWCGEEQVSFF